MKKILLSTLLLPFLAFAQTTLPTSWNFSTPGAATPPTGWSYSLGTGNLTYQSGIGDNVSLRLDVTGEYLQIDFAEKPGPVSYYVKGTAISPNPPFTGTFSVQQSANGTSWTTVRAFTSMSSTLTRYEDNLLSATRFVRFFYTEKQNGSNVQLDSVLIQSPPPSAAGVSLSANGNTLVNGGEIPFGNASEMRFDITNIGISDDLIIDSIVVSGTNASDFTVGNFQTSVPHSGFDTFYVRFNPQANGSRFGTLKVYTNDVERNPFSVNLYAIGGRLASEPTTQAETINIGGLRTFAMNVSFGRAGGGSEKYILLRKTGSSITDVPVDSVTYKKGDYIGSSQVAYIGDDTALIKPTYILANTDYSYAAFSFNGPEGYENYNTTTPPTKSVKTPANEIGNYYTAVNPLVNTFITDLANRIRSPHDTVFYSNYAPTLVNTFLTRDTAGGKKIVNCVYTGIAYVYEEPFLWQSSTNTTGILTREHTFAQSWMPTKTTIPTFPEVGGKEVSEYNDLHHLFPADQNNANGVRSNNPFGIVVNATTTSPTGFGKKGTDANGKVVYEPKDDQKGNLARALFYMLVHYNGDRGNQWRLPANQDLAVLLQWHQQDAPDALEIARNEYIASIQHNRNPFIDHPEWTSRIDFSTMTYIADPYAKLITVTAPNGGENLITGSTKNITWTSQNVDTVVIEYRSANNTPWVLISDTVLGSSKTFSWSVPSLITSTAKIKISEKGNVTIADSSNNVFSIDLERSISLIAPNGGETYKQGDSMNISWTSLNVDTVKVEIQTAANGPFTFIGETVAALDSLKWKITSPITNSAKVRVSMKSKSSVNDVSALVFSITQPVDTTTRSLVINSPNGGEIWSKNSTGGLVKWTSTGVDSVIVELLINDTLFLNLGKILASKDSLVVDASNLPVTDSAKIRLLATNVSLTSVSSAPFHISLMGSVKNVFSQNSFFIYPNPSRGLINIDIKDEKVKEGQLSIIDITGRLVVQKDIISSTTIELTQQGVYFVKLQTENGSVVKKLIIE
jgi:hypothetical protein